MYVSKDFCQVFNLKKFRIPTKKKNYFMVEWILNYA